MNPNFRLGLIVLVFVVMGGVIWAVLGDRATSDGEANAPAHEPPPVADASTPESESFQDTSFSADEPIATETGNTLEASGGRTQKNSGAQQLEQGPYSVYGNVVLEDGTAVPNATVSFLKIDHMEFDLRSEKHVRAEYTANAKGEFTIDGLQSGSIMLSARHEGYAGSTRTHVSEWTPNANVTLKLSAAESIRGTVVNKDGDPVAGVLVAPTRSEDTEAAGTGTEFFMTKVETGEDGAFSLEGLRPGHWDILALSDDYATAEVKSVATKTDGLEIVLEGGGALSGTIVSADTRDPIEGVEVVAGYSELAYDRHAATSDGEGRFRFAALRTGEYTIGINDEIRILTSRVEPVEIVADQEWEGLELLVADGGIVTGRVIDAETGRGISGAVLNGAPDSSNFTSTPPAAIRIAEPTGPDGAYRLAGLGDSKYTVYIVSVPGYPTNQQQNRVNVVVDPGRHIDNVDFPLNRGLRIAGRVLDADGKPVPDAAVFGRSDNWESRDNGKSRADGRFELTGFSFSDAYVWAEHKGMITDVEGPLRLHEAPATDLLLKLKDVRNCVIAGDVVDASGRPLAKVNVWINATGRKHMSMPGHTTDEDGKFEVADLPPGTYTVRCSTPGGFMQGGDYGEAITLKDGERREGVRIILNLVEGLSITGRVTGQGGNPLQGVGINGWSQTNGGRSVYANSDKDGTFTLSGLVEGPYHLDFQRHGYSRVVLDDIEAGTRDLEVELTGSSTLRGRIVDAETGDPIQEFEVQAVQGRETQMQGWHANNMQRFIDPQGFFETTTDTTGDVTIIARASGYAPAFQLIDVAKAASEIDDIQIEMETGGAVNGTVVDDSGKPVAHANVYIGEVPDQWQRDRSAAVVTDDLGAFALEGLGKNDRVVSAWHPAYSAGSARVPLRRSKTPTVEIVLSAGGTIHGLITVGGQSPDGRAFINYTPENQDQQYGEVNVDGTYEVTGLSPGPVEVVGYLRTSEDDSRRIVRQAIVASDEVTQVDFDFPELNAAMSGRVMIGEVPATEGSVRATVQTSVGEETFGGSIEPNGSYRIEAMAAGTAEVRASGWSDDARGEQTITLHVPANQTTTQDFDLQKYIRVTGRVAGGTAAERGVAAFRGHIAMSTPVTPAQLLVLDQSRVDRFTFNNQPGPFEYEVDLPGPGEYTLAAYATDGGDAESLAAMSFATVYVTVSEGETLTIDMEIP